MAKNFRRAAKRVINSRSNNGLLGLVIFDEKLVCENFKKLVNSKANSSLALLKWAKNEENKAIKDVFSKTFEVTGIWTTVWTEFLEEHQKYRGTFKELLHEERVLDEVIKQEAVYAAKLNRLQKQFQQAKGMSSKVVSSEMAQVISQAEKAHAELEVKQTKHEILKARRLRSSLHEIADGLQKWAEQSIAVSKAYRNLANLIPDTPTQFTENVYPGAGQGRKIVSELAVELKVKPEFSAELAAAASHGSQNAYLYAMSPLLKQINPQDEYTHPTTPDAKNGKARKPQPLPKTKLKMAAARNYQLVRPMSAGDLRPCAPPSSPPPPLPMASLCPVPSQQSNGKLWYARTKLLELRRSDSEDSDGYTEPIPHVKHSISDSGLNRLKEREKSSVREPDTAEVYQHLARMANKDINDIATYVDLFG